MARPPGTLKTEPGVGLRETILREALAAVREFRDVSEFGKALADLAPHLPKTLLLQALDMARALSPFGMNERYWRAAALTALAVQLPYHKRSIVLHEALEAITAPLVRPDEPLKYTRKSGGEWRADALINLAPYLPESDRQTTLREALETIKACRPSETWKSKALATIAPLISKDIRRHIVQKALDAARKCLEERENICGEVIADLAPYLTDKQVSHGLNDAREISDGYCRAKALTALAARMPLDTRKPVLGEALDAVVKLVVGEGQFPWRSEALIALSAHLPDLDRDSLLRKAIIFPKWLPEFRHNEILVAVAPHLPASLLPEALAIARTKNDQISFPGTIAALAARLPDADREAILHEALAAAEAIADQFGRARALADLVPHSQKTARKNLLRQAFNAAMAVEQYHLRVRVLTDLGRAFEQDSDNIIQLPENNSRLIHTPSVNGIQNNVLYVIFGDNKNNAAYNNDIMSRLLESVETSIIDKKEGFEQEPHNDMIRTLKFNKFPGARAMKLPFKEAVETFISFKYGARIGPELTRADIFREDEKLYIAIKNYERDYGPIPFDIPSIRTLARERFDHVVSVGIENAPRRDRDAAHRLIKRKPKHPQNG
jgi:hypothetical protein